MKKYEHQIMPVDFNGDRNSLAQDDSILNGLGKEGWVLISAVPVVRNGNTVQILYCMMRPLP
jgi:hypothetical protein